MKLIPTQFERTFLLCAVLAFLAFLLPECWTTPGRRSSFNIYICLIWVYTGLLFLTSAITATKRQPIVALIAMCSLIFVYLSATEPGRYARYDVGPKVTGINSLATAAIVLGIACLAVFALSFAASFLLDRWIRPIWGSEKLIDDSDEDDLQVTAATSKRFRLLIVAVVGLFIFQAVNNMFGTGISDLGWVRPLLVPATIVFFSMLGCGLICRLPIVIGLVVGAFLAISYSGCLTLLVYRNGSVNVFYLAIACLVSAAIIATAFGLLGNSKARMRWNNGWLSWLTVVVGCGLTFIGGKYDIFTLLLGNRPFDMARAAYVKTINGDPDVRVVHQLPQWKGTMEHLLVSFSADSGTDFFGQFDSTGITTGLCKFVIEDMGASVDLKSLSRLEPVTLDFRNCKLSSQQLADTFQLGVAVTFDECDFLPGEFNGDVSIDCPALYLMTEHGDGKIAEFAESIKDFELNSVLNVFIKRIAGKENSTANVENSTAILRMLDSMGDGAGAIFLDSAQFEFEPAQLKSQKNISRLTLQNCVFKLSQDKQPGEREAFVHVLESEIGVTGRVGDNDLLWELTLGAVGKFEPFDVPGYSISDHVANNFQYLEDLKQSAFAYRGSGDSDDVRHFWFPCYAQSLAGSIAEVDSLETLSFDIDWLGSEFLASHLSSQPQRILDISDLDQLTNLRELYLSYFEKVDLSVLKSLSKLETVQFTSSSKGYSGNLFPQLKEVRILLDKPIKNGLMKQLAATGTLRSLVVFNYNATKFDEDKFLARAIPWFKNRVKIQVINITEGESLPPEHFIEHRRDVRRKCIRKYLRDEAASR